mgnify:CR=1 FL=1|tara:strand:+ start:2376 stop:3683 length:1308 start_codon:yes stop_codon:yes gene_type:complete
MHRAGIGLCLFLLGVAVSGYWRPSKGHDVPSPEDQALEQDALDHVAAETNAALAAASPAAGEQQSALKPLVFRPWLPLPDGFSLSEFALSFDAYFREQLTRAGVPGGAYAIVEGGRVVKMGSYGVRRLGGTAPVDEHTVFRLASVSKTFAAGLSARLVEERKFSWEDRINQYVPDFRFRTPEYSRDLQVQHILSQSSGLIPNAYDNLLEANVPLPKIISKFSDLDPYCAPGECYGYQNVLYSLIQPVMEQATASSYEQLMQEEIFAPLGMEDASVGLEGFLSSPNRATPHIKTRSGWKVGRVDPSYYSVLPAAGVNASVVDLAKWLSAQLGYEPEVLTPEMLATLTEPRVRTQRELRRRGWRNYIEDAYYGLGWRIYHFGTEELVYHSGWVSGFRADVAYSRRHNIGLVILLNAESNVISDLSTHFWSAILQPAE